MTTIKVELYGHYDSRGGAGMYGTTREHADRAWDYGFHMGDEGILESWGDFRPSAEEHLATLDVQVLEMPEDGTDLVYAEEGDVRLWTNTDDWYKDDLNDYSWVISRTSPGGGWHVAEFLGEDAFGVVWNIHLSEGK